MRMMMRVTMVMMMMMTMMMVMMMITMVVTMMMRMMLVIVMMVLMVERTRPLFTRLTLKCASHHNGVHFFHISTSKSGPRMVCLVHFGLEMCFAPQRRPLFPQFPRVVREWCAWYILTWKCASRHNGVHFFDSSTSKRVPNVRCFQLVHLQLCFAPPRRATFHLSSGQMAPHLPL